MGSPSTWHHDHLATIRWPLSLGQRFSAHQLTHVCLVPASGGPGLARPLPSCGRTDVSLTKCKLNCHRVPLGSGHCHPGRHDDALWEAVPFKCPPARSPARRPVRRCLPPQLSPDGPSALGLIAFHTSLPPPSPSAHYGSPPVTQLLVPKALQRRRQQGPSPPELSACWTGNGQDISKVPLP